MVHLALTVLAMVGIIVGWIVFAWLCVMIVEAIYGRDFLLHYSGQILGAVLFTLYIALVVAGVWFLYAHAPNP